MSFNPTQVSDDFFNTPQIAVEDIPAIVAQGYKTILNCRPDGEGGAGQPSGAQLKAAAEQYGLQYCYFPVAMGTSGAEHLAEAAKALAAAPKPVLGFCKSGMRAANLYQAATVGAGNKSLLQWLKSKCLITRFWRWCKNKRCCSR